MIKLDINKLKKKIIYKCSYSGTRETDLLYKKKFIKNIDNFKSTDLNQILNLFTNFSDQEIFNFLIGKKNPPKKHKKLFQKLLDD